MSYYNNKLEIRKTEKGKSLFARKDINKNEIILEFEKNFLPYPTKTSMQIDENIHQESKNPDAFENFINHSCEPNSYINFRDLTLRVIRKIKKGEEITYNYLTTEWELKSKFQCKCGSGKCYGHIKGFKYLTKEQQKDLLPFISPFLKKKINKKNKFINF